MGRSGPAIGRAEARTQHVEEPGKAPAAILLARSEGHDLVVAGARADGRLKERIFGRITDDMLAAGEIAWLLAN